MRWRSISLSVLVLFALLLAACGGSAPASVSPPKAENKSAPVEDRAAEPARPAPSRPAESKPAEAPKPASARPAEPIKPAESRPAPADAAAPGAAPAAPQPAEAAKPASGGVAAESRPAGGDGGRRPQPTMAPPIAPVPPCHNCPPPSQDPLRAKSVDDNQGFDEYLRYLRDYRGLPVWPVDVSQRVLIAVTDANQRSVANATVRIYSDQTLVFDGRTYTNGQTIFHPRSVRGAVQANEFIVTVEKEGRLTTRNFRPDGNDVWSITLDGPAIRLGQPVRLDLLILIDSTGSMGGEISKIQTTLSSIVSRIGQLGGQPIIRFGGVTYRDRSDAYVTKKFNFSDDVQSFQSWLNGIRAGGGGDYPEALNEALHVAVSEMDWDRGDAVRLVFLVADAPPHLDYPNDHKYTTETVQAVSKGIKLYTIGASGLTPQGEYVFRQLAQQTLAQYIFITRGGDEQSGGGTVSNTNIQSPENNLDDIIVRIVRQEIRHLVP